MLLAVEGPDHRLLVFLRTARYDTPGLWNQNLGAGQAALAQPEVGTPMYAWG